MEYIELLIAQYFEANAQHRHVILPTCAEELKTSARQIASRFNSMLWSHASALNYIRPGTTMNPESTSEVLNHIKTLCNFVF